MGALWAALNAEPDLWRRAAEQNVYIADEQTLYAAIRIVQLTWTQVQQAENHEKVFALADEMVDRVEKFIGSYEAVGKALETAAKVYTEGHRKGQSILTTARKLTEMGAKKGKVLEKAMLDIDDIEDIAALPEPENTTQAE
jgi:DNA recombination protein RmuC